jgi:hypothetical protein
VGQAEVRALDGGAVAVVRIRNSPSLRVTGSLVVAECVDELAFAHLRTSLYAELLGAVLQVLLRPLLVAGKPTPSLAQQSTPRVGGTGLTVVRA